MKQKITLDRWLAMAMPVEKIHIGRALISLEKPCENNIWHSLIAGARRIKPACFATLNGEKEKNPTAINGEFYTRESTVCFCTTPAVIVANKTAVGAFANETGCAQRGVSARR